MNKVAYYLVIVIGVITILGFFPHAFMGMQTVQEHIAKGEIQKPAADAMRMIWFYSSVMMLISGIWLLLLANPIFLGSNKARLQVLFLGIGLAVFGLGCTYISGRIDAMFLFSLEGILLIAASTLFFIKADHHHHH